MNFFRTWRAMRLLSRIQSVTVRPLGMDWDAMYLRCDMRRGGWA